MTRRALFRASFGVAATAIAGVKGHLRAKTLPCAALQAPLAVAPPAEKLFVPATFRMGWQVKYDDDALHSSVFNKLLLEAGRKQKRREEEFVAQVFGPFPNGRAE